MSKLLVSYLFLTFTVYYPHYFSNKVAKTSIASNHKNFLYHLSLFLVILFKAEKVEFVCTVPAFQVLSRQ